MTPAATDRDALIGAIVDEMRRNSTATVLMHHAIAERLGLHPTDHKVADILSRGGPLTPGEIAERTGLSSGAVTGVIDRLEEAGWVRREPDPSDRRRVHVRLVADRARDRRVRRLFGPLAEAATAFARDFDDEELRFVLEFMRRLNELVEERIQELRTAQ